MSADKKIQIVYVVTKPVNVLLFVLYYTVNVSV